MFYQYLMLVRRSWGCSTLSGSSVGAAALFRVRRPRAITLQLFCDECNPGPTVEEAAYWAQPPTRAEYRARLT